MTVFKTEAGAMRHVTRAYITQKIGDQLPAAEARRIASIFARSCPLDIQRERFGVLYGSSPLKQAEAARQANAAIVMAETMDKRLTRNATLTETLEDVLLRVKIALDGKLITPAQARTMRTDIGRRLRGRRVN